MPIKLNGLMMIQKNASQINILRRRILMDKQSELKTYTINQLADMLQFSRRTIYNYIKEGKLKGMKFSSGWRFTEKEVIEFMTLHRARALNSK
jgi:excisionase family DNA binding protein